MLEGEKPTRCELSGARWSGCCCRRTMMPLSWARRPRWVGGARQLSRKDSLKLNNYVSVFFIHRANILWAGLAARSVPGI